jgi:hypothetical protein
MDVGELRRRAETELVALGPVPDRPREFEAWEAERNGAAVLLAAVAAWDAPLLRRAALSGDDLTNRDASELLLDASNACA